MRADQLKALKEIDIFKAEFTAADAVAIEHAVMPAWSQAAFDLAKRVQSDAEAALDCYSAGWKEFGHFSREDVLPFLHQPLADPAMELEDD